MSIKKISKEQPENFEFNSINLATANKIIDKTSIPESIAKEIVKTVKKT